ncbi:sensor histidine kinase [uncultured Enterovirga sp.]|uniref:sensor histidine kinase n=1 Tax=uncultured Enterovirga sp. TaxID=2026352 RepID=UPI0035CA6C48
MRSLFERPTYLGLSRRRLQTLYLVAAAGLAALVPLMLLAGFWIRAEFGKGQRDIETLLGARASSLAQQVDADLQQQLSALQALSALPTLDGSVESFEETAGRMTAVMPHWTTLSLVDAATGRIVVSTRAEARDEPSEARLRDVVAGGKPLIETRPIQAGQDGGILLYVPVVRREATRFVLLMTFNAKEIQDIVLRQPRDGALLSVVVDGEHRILARSHGFDAIGTEVMPTFQEAIKGRESGLINATSREGEPIASAFRRSPLTGWVSITSISRRESDGLMSRTVWATSAAGALSLILAGILAVFIIHTVMERRVSEERLAASRALGDLDARLLATTQEALGEQRKAASEREVLLREIYHRVKNNLQIVQSLLRLGSRDLHPDQREPFENAVRRIGAMARVHTLLYNSPDLASIDFKDYLDELLKELSEGFAAGERGIEHVLDANAMRMPLDTAVPLAFIAVEILTNSFKHAFPEGRAGRITVEVGRGESSAVLRIRDDGVGMKSGGASKRRLGLTIVRKLVQQIGGTLEEPPPGSSVFVVRFPLDPEKTLAVLSPQAPVQA